MLRTLHAYLLKDLLKVTLLTLVALTLLMSVLAIIQPLRKLGLAGEQVLELFIYTIPVMLSMTLPVATLFASTLIYGRFSQDNELLAARASGISTLSLLRPALGVGVVVTIISLLMINVVAPKLSTLSGLVQNNIRQIFFHQLQSRGYADYSHGRQRFVVHADAVDADANALYGVVLVIQNRPKADDKKDKPSKAATQPATQKASDADKKPPKGGQKAGSLKSSGTAMVWARWADVTFAQDPNGEDKAYIRALEPMVAAGSTLRLPFGKSGKYVLLPAMPIENPIKEKTSWYSWNDLLRTLKNPQGHPKVRRELAKIRQSLCSDMLSSEIARTIQDDKAYQRFTQGDETFRVRAAWAVPGKSGATLLSARPKDPNDPEAKPKNELVSVEVKRDNKLIDYVTAQRGRVTLAESRLTNVPQVTIRLEGDVTVEHVSPVGGVTRTKSAEWSRGELPLPEGILAKSQSVTLGELYQDPNQLTKDPKVIASIDKLTHKRIPQLKADLVAELHVRVAYGASCFLMVAMGAALGLMFRGGQFISAFALSAVPAAAVIVMLLMGKEMVRNPASSETLGLACVWGGIVGLLAANIVIYARLARK